MFFVRKSPWNILLWGAIVAAVWIAFPNEPAVSSAQQDAWLEAKPACVFTLAGDALPASGVLFAQALTTGLGRMAVTPPLARLVQTQFDAYPTLSQLRIDLSNSTEDADHKPPKVNWHFIPRAGVRTGRLEVLADPLTIQGAKVQYDLTASDADLNLAQDRQGRPLLMLMGTTHGHFAASAAEEDVQTLCLAAARRFAGKYGFSIDSLTLDLSTPSPRSLEAKMVVVLGGRMDGTLHLSGRFDVADDLTATASHLTCQGDGPGGLLISGMLLPGLFAYDGKTKPLVVFPFNSMRLRDVQIRADDGLRITAEFGNRL
jgi:hypothetical protein